MKHKFTPPPYNYIHEVDLTNGDYIKPNDVVICEIRCKSEGTVNMTTRKMAEKNKPAQKRRYSDYDIDRIDLHKIFQNGTSPALNKNQLTVAGHYIEDLSGA